MCTGPGARSAGTSSGSTSCACTEPTTDRGSGYVTVRGGDRFAHHGTFVPGSGNPIGFEDLITIEDYEFCAAVAEARPFEPGFEQALAWALVQDALLRSAHSGAWVEVAAIGDGVAV